MGDSNSSLKNEIIQIIKKEFINELENNPKLVKSQLYTTNIIYSKLSQNNSKYIQNKTQKETKVKYLNRILNELANDGFLEKSTAPGTFYITKDDLDWEKSDEFDLDFDLNEIDIDQDKIDQIEAIAKQLTDRSLKPSIHGLTMSKKISANSYNDCPWEKIGSAGGKLFKSMDKTGSLSIFLFKTGTLMIQYGGDGCKIENGRKINTKASLKIEDLDHFERRVRDVLLSNNLIKEEDPNSILADFQVLQIGIAKHIGLDQSILPINNLKEFNIKYKSFKNHIVELYRKSMEDEGDVISVGIHPDTKDPKTNEPVKYKNLSEFVYNFSSAIGNTGDILTYNAELGSSVDTIQRNMNIVSQNINEMVSDYNSLKSTLIKLSDFQNAKINNISETTERAKNQTIDLILNQDLENKKSIRNLNNKIANIHSRIGGIEKMINSQTRDSDELISLRKAISILSKEFQFASNQIIQEINLAHSELTYNIQNMATVVESNGNLLVQVRADQNVAASRTEQFTLAVTEALSKIGEIRQDHNVLTENSIAMIRSNSEVIREVNKSNSDSFKNLNEFMMTLGVIQKNQQDEISEMKAIIKELAEQKKKSFIKRLFGK